MAGPQTSPDLSLSVPRLGPALPVDSQGVVNTRPSMPGPKPTASSPWPREAPRVLAEPVAREAPRSRRVAFEPRGKKEPNFNDLKKAKKELKEPMIMRQPMTPADWSGSLRRSKPPPKRRTLDVALSELDFSPENLENLMHFTPAPSPFARKTGPRKEELLEVPSMEPSAVPLVASEAGSTASDYAYTWPSEQFEPLGSMIRSLEFQVGALFELMDAHSDADPSVLEVIDRKREAVHDTFQALKEAVWWTRRRRERRRDGHERTRLVEAPGHGLRSERSERSERSGLLELEALQSQLDARISQVVEAADAPEPARPSVRRQSSPGSNGLRELEACSAPRGAEPVTQSRDAGLVMTPTYFHFRTED